MLSRWGTPELNAKLLNLKVANLCEEAIELVRAADAKEDSSWYAWMIGFDLDCLAKTGERRYADDALRLADEGRRRLPKSSRLVLLKGFIYSRLGEDGFAQRYSEEAVKLALANIGEGHGSEEDRLVAKNAGANVNAPRTPTP